MSAAPWWSRAITGTPFENASNTTGPGRISQAGECEDIGPRVMLQHFMVRPPSEPIDPIIDAKAASPLAARRIHVSIA